MIVSVAAYTAVDRAETDVQRATVVNAVAPGYLAAEAVRLGVPILHISTDYVFNGLKLGEYTEADRVDPRTVYGITKLAGEQAVAASGADYAILRTSWIYGPHGRNFVLTMLALSQSRDRIGVVADQIGNPSYSFDIAAGILQVATAFTAGRGRSGVFHMAGAQAASWAEFARAIFESGGKRGLQVAEVDPLPTSAYPTLAARPPNSRLNCAKLEEIFGVSLPGWRASLDKCLDEICMQIQG